MTRGGTRDREWGGGRGGEKTDTVCVCVCVCGREREGESETKKRGLYLPYARGGLHRVILYLRC